MSDTNHTAATTETKSNKKGSNWLLWWNVDTEELHKQIAGYTSLGITKSARKLSAILLTFSAALSIFFIYYGLTDPAGVFDISIFLFLAAFVWRGHRWALVVAMIFWSFEKGLYVTSAFMDGSVHGGILISQLLWWAAYMHAFFLAFKVEQARSGKKTDKFSEEDIKETFS